MTLEIQKRCEWVNLKNNLYISYHDQEWGVPVFDDKKLFEMLILEGAQAGLSWEIVLNKRENYRKAFDGFDYVKIAAYDDKKEKELLQNTGIIRNRLKIKSAIKNARVFLEIQEEFESFNKYIWAYVSFKPIKSSFKSIHELPSKTELSDKISKDLIKRGMSFVGSTIIYSFIQSVGLVNDHIITCFRYKEC